MSGSGGSLALLRQLRELWNQDFEETLRRALARASGLAIGAGALPPGTVINRGDYLVTAGYRTGDLVVAAGIAYIAIAPSTGVHPPDLAYWQPLGGASSVPPPFVYITDADGTQLVDDDGAYLWENE
jgi:hypothetical protein